MKRFLHFVVERICYYLGVDNLFYWLNRRSKRIITFHNVLPDSVATGLYVDYVSNTESEFRVIVREVKKHFAFSADLKDYRTATITFDDGYLNQFEVAAKVLNEEGNIPAIIFVSGHNIDRSDCNALVVDKILLWLSAVPDGEYRLPCGLRFVVGAGQRGALWTRVLRPAFMVDVKKRGAGLLAELDAAYPLERILSSLPKEYLRLRLNGISSAQIVELRKLGWIVGWHTQSHFPLAALDNDCSEHEMIPIKDQSMRDVVFSYPYGDLMSVSKKDLEIAKSIGYPCAVSNVFVDNDLVGRYFLPRCDLSANKFKLHFRLSGVEYFIRHRKLLPKVN